MTRITIIGFGRFGRTLYRLLKDDFEVVIYDSGGVYPAHVELGHNATITEDEAEAYKSDVIFYAVPISEFESVIAAHKKYFRPEHLLIDVLAVKMYPAKVFKKSLSGSKTQALLTHPMFGPDSSKSGFDGLPIILDKFTAGAAKYKFWKDYFTAKKLRVVQMTAEQHDKLAANSQGLTHFIGRLLEEYKFAGTPIDTLGAEKLLEVKDQVCSDTWQLFNDLQHFNP